MISTIGLWVFIGCWVAVCVFSFLGRQNVLGVILSALLGLFLVGEIVAYKTTGMSITSRFRKFRGRLPGRTWTILGLIGLGIVALILHLGC